MDVVDVALLAAATVLLLCVLVGVWRALRGPTARDRLTAFVLLGTTGAALLVVLASVVGDSALRDAALVVVALATVVVVVLVGRRRA